MTTTHKFPSLQEFGDQLQALEDVVGVGQVVRVGHRPAAQAQDGRAGWHHVLIAETSLTCIIFFQLMYYIILLSLYDIYLYYIIHYKHHLFV